MRWSRTPILLLLSRCLTIRRAPQKEWLLYPAYPRHFFSLRGLVHICIPHTGTPCGRGLYRQGLTRLSWVLLSASALLPSLCFYYSILLTICQALFLFFLGAVGDSNPHFNFSPHLGDTLTCSPVFAGGATRTHIIPLPTQPKTPATDGRTRLERVEWHNGGLSATEAHHLRFVPLLYHNLGDLSRGFLHFFSSLQA